MVSKKLKCPIYIWILKIIYETNFSIYIFQINGVNAGKNGMNEKKVEEIRRFTDSLAKN